MFKEKTSKKRLHIAESAKDTGTLDARHTSMIEKLQQNQGMITTLESEQQHIENELERLGVEIKQLKAAGQFDTDYYDSIWTSNLNLLERQKDNKRKLNDLISGKEEIDYYENTGYILFKYYDIIDNQTTSMPLTTNRITPVSATKSVKNRKKTNHMPAASVSILEAFKLEDNKKVQKQVDDKSKLVDEYLSHIDSSYLKTSTCNDISHCNKCNIPLVCLQQDGVTVCPTCGYQEVLLVEQNRPLLRNNAKDSTSHASYKRINHFREWCSQVQGKESTDIPEEVFEHILAEIKKEKITDTRKISNNKMRDILKKLRYNKFYEHSNYIMNRINGVQPPHFSPELEEKLCTMFKEIQAPFLKHCPLSRKNFLSYSYCLHKMFQILGMPEYLKWFALLKSKSKLYMQDQIFKAICDDLGWPFYPSL